MSNGTMSHQDLLDIVPSSDVADRVAGKITHDELMSIEPAPALPEGPAAAPLSRPSPAAAPPPVLTGGAPWLAQGIETAMGTMAKPTPFESEPTPEFEASTESAIGTGTTGLQAFAEHPAGYVGQHAVSALRGLYQGTVPEWMGGKKYDLPEAERKRPIAEQVNISIGDRNAIVAYVERMDDPDMVRPIGAERSPAEEFLENAAQIEGRAKTGAFSVDHYTSTRDALNAEIDRINSWLAVKSPALGALPADVASAYGMTPGQAALWAGRASAEAPPFAC